MGDDTDREKGLLLPVLVVLEVELLEIPQQADDRQGHAHDPKQVGPG